MKIELFMYVNKWHGRQVCRMSWLQYRTAGSSYMNVLTTHKRWLLIGDAAPAD